MVENIKLVGKLDKQLQEVLLNEIEQQPELWKEATLWAQEHHPYLAKNNTCVPLIAGKVEPYEVTPFYTRYPLLVKYLTDTYKILTRINIQKLKVLSSYPKHIDEGVYFVGKDRYAMCLQSSYKLVVGDVSTKVSPGDVVWFDNKKPHEAINIGSKERIAVIFDVPKENECKS